MLRSYTTKSIALLAVFIGLLVMAGWILNIEPLKSIIPAAPTMKSITALCFILSGIILITSNKLQSDKTWAVGSIILPIAILALLLIMITPLISSLTDVPLGIEELFVDKPEIFTTVATPDMPSIGTMSNFVLIAIAGVMVMFRVKRLCMLLHIIGTLICLIAASALVGYVIDEPFLYYFIADYSTGMALHTAVLFILLGIGFTLTGGPETCPSKQN